MLLSITIVILNIVTFKNIESDAEFINDAGSLRFLNHRMDHNAQEIYKVGNNASQEKLELEKSMAEYEIIIEKLTKEITDKSVKKQKYENYLEGILYFNKQWYQEQKDELATMSSYIDELIYDGLTKTYNRRTGLSRLTAILENPREGLHFSLVFVDLNGLKDVNDFLGHEVGDDFLILAVSTMKEAIREEDFIIRLGGDEFLIALKDANEETAEAIWKRIQEQYDIINNTIKKDFCISVSHGIAEYNHRNNLSLIYGREFGLRVLW